VQKTNLYCVTLHLNSREEQVQKFSIPHSTLFYKESKKPAEVYCGVCKTQKWEVSMPCTVSCWW